MRFVKEIFLAAFIFLSISSLSFGQAVPAPPSAPDKPKENSSSNNFYIKIFGGYGFLTPGSSNLSATTVSVDGANTAFTNSKSGLGGGLHFGGGVGVILNDFLNVGIDAEYLKAKNINVASVYTNSPYYSTRSELLTHSTFSIIPNITFKAFSKPTYYFYTRLGVLIDLQTNLQLTGKDSTYNQTGGNTYIYLTNGVQKYSYNLNIGAQIAVGIQFRITDVLRGFAEIAGNFLPVSPSSLYWTFTTTDSKNGGMPTVVNFITKYTYASSGSNQFMSSNSGNTVTSSETLAKLTQNINYIGLNIGVVLRL